MLYLISIFSFRICLIADLSERISIVYFPTDKNQYGDLVKGEENLRCTVWAKVYPLTAKISDNTPERTNNINYRVIIRHRADILPDDEIVWRRRRLKMLSPPYDYEGKRKYLTMECAEVVEDGKATQESL